MKIVFKPKEDLAVFQDTRAEQCGVLFGKRTPKTYTVEALAAVKNHSDDPYSHFEIKTGDVRRVMKRLGYTEADIIGSIHTHPRGSKADPSAIDVEDLPEGMLGVVYHVTSRTLSYYNHEAGWLDKETL